MKTETVLKRSYNATLIIFLTAAVCSAADVKQSAYPTKSSPVAIDKALIIDSADGNKTKNVQLGALPVSTPTQTALDSKANATSFANRTAFTTAWGWNPGDNLGSATAANISSLFFGTGDCLKSDGTKGDCGTGGSMTWPASDSAYYGARNGAWVNLSGIFAAPLGSDDNYVTDAEKVKIGNLSGTNTGDQDLSGYALISSIPTISDTAYGSSWNGDTGAASKNAIYDKIETIAGGSMTYPGAGISVSTGSAWGTSLALDTDLSSVSASDDSVPSAKATKSALDALPDIVFGTGLTVAEDTPSVGTDTVSVTANIYQAYDADLTIYAGITPSANIQSLLGAANYAAMRTLLDLEVGTDFNAYDADLEDLSDGSLTASKVAGSAATTASKSTTYTIGTDSVNESYGGTVYVTSATTVTAPAVVSGMNFSVVTIGDVAVSLDINAADKMILDGVTLADGDKATNSSKAGDTITCQYYSADGWYCWSGTVLGGHWTDGN